MHTALKKRYPHLLDIRLVVGSQKCFDYKVGGYHRDNVISSVAAAGAKLLAKHLHSEVVVAVGPGEIVKATVSAVRLPEPIPELHIVPLTGYLSPHHTENSANLIGGILEKRTGGQFHWLPVVGIMEQQDRKAVERLPVVRDALQILKTTSVVLTSVGPVDSAYLKNFVSTRSFLSRDLIREYVRGVRRNRPVGVIGAWQFDKQGIPLDSPFGFIGFDLESMRSLVEHGGKVIVVAGAANKQRVRAVHASLVGQICNCLVTDHCTAQALLDMQ